MIAKAWGGVILWVVGAMQIGKDTIRQSPTSDVSSLWLCSSSVVGLYVAESMCSGGKDRIEPQRHAATSKTGRNDSLSFVYCLLQSPNLFSGSAIDGFSGIPIHHVLKQSKTDDSAPATIGALHGPFSDEEWVEVFQSLHMSPQQSRIIVLLVGGLGDKQIAQQLGIAIPTLRTHIGRIFTRLGVADRAELVLRIFCEFRRGCRDCPRRQRR